MPERATIRHADHCRDHDRHRGLIMYGTYLRLDVTVHDGWRTVVRAAAMKLTPEARADPTRRAGRHRFYRQMLAYHEQAQEIVRVWRL